MEELTDIKSHNFKKQFGQNFITDKNLLAAIVGDASVTKDTTVLEIGAGAGTLTRELALRAKKVVSYEIDTSLRDILSQSLRRLDNVEVVFRDFMKENFGRLEEELGTYIVVANLPYYITTPVIMKFVEESGNAKSLTVMVQEEVADRLCAKAGTAEYGAVTAAIARRGIAEVKRKVSKTLFYPRPKVDSAVVNIDFSRGGFPVKSEKVYRETVRCAFGNRRKTLVNNLMSCFSLPRERAAVLLTELGIDERARGETLTPLELGLLSDKLTL